MAKLRAYFDTSVIVKRYVAEPGSPGARALMQRYRVVSSALTPIEILSALTRRHAAGDLSDRDFAAILAGMDRDRHLWELVEVTALILGRAEDLVRAGVLRTLDAIHVASALVFESGVGIQVPFITDDHRQRAGARQAGLKVVG